MSETSDLLFGNKAIRTDGEESHDGRRAPQIVERLAYYSVALLNDFVDFEVTLMRSFLCVRCDPCDLVKDLLAIPVQRDGMKLPEELPI